MTDEDNEMLNRIAQPDVNGVPGALGQVALDTLLTAGYVEFGFVPPVDGGSPTYADAWVAVTDAGRAYLNGE